MEECTVFTSQQVSLEDIFCNRGMQKDLSDKKREEKRCLDLLIKLYPDFPRGRIVPGESPDFIIRSTTKRKTGVELTRYTRNGDGKYPGESHFHPELSRDSLVELLESKEEKLALYRKKRLDQIWLVILVSSFTHSSSVNVHNQLARWKIRSAFDSILIMDLSLEKVYEVI